MPLVSVSCPSCGGSVYVSLPVGRRFVTAEPGEGEEGASDLETTTATCSACDESFPVVHGSGSNNS